MNKRIVHFTLIASTWIGAMWLFTACNRNSNPGAAPKSVVASAEKNSFKEVTSHLDSGGNLYLYLGTEQFLRGLSTKVTDLREFLSGMPMNPNEGEKLSKVFEIVSRLVKNSGLEQVSGVGMSSIARQAGFYHSKVVVHHYRGESQGYLWNLFGKTPHGLDLLDLLPETTALALSFDVDLPQSYSILRNELLQVGIPDADRFINELPAAFEKATGIRFDQFLSSFGGEYGLVLTLDDSKKIALPLGPNPLEIPEPGLMLVLKVKDDTIFNRVEKLMAEKPDQAAAVVRVDKGGLRMRTMPVPLPLPITARPTLARHGDYLFIASSDALVQDAVSVKKGEKKGWKSTDEYKKLSQGMPQKGNSFQFVSLRLGKTISQIQQQALKNSGQLKPAQAETMQRLFGAGRLFSSFAIAANTEEGWIITGNGSQSLNTAVLLPALAMPVGLMAAIAVPNFIKAREAAQGNNRYSQIQNNLRMIEAAKDQWAIEKKKANGTALAESDLSDYLPGGAITPVAGETYQINSVGTVPSAKIPVSMNGKPAGSTVTAND